MRRVFGTVVAGGLALALSSGMGWAQALKTNPAGASKGETAETTGDPVQMVATASLHLANAVADLREKNFDTALNKIILAAKAMRGLTTALASEQDKADALARDLEAARAEVAALKPQAAAQVDLSQERRKADQREAELQQERQRAEALARELVAARAEAADLGRERQKAEILGKLVQAFKREDALKRDLQAARAPVPAGPSRTGASDAAPSAGQAARAPAAGSSAQAQGASEGAGPGGGGRAARTGAAVTGRSGVVDNATLRINGALVRLIGVEPAPEPDRAPMAHYLGERPVTCWPVSAGARYRCEVEGADLSRVVLYNGGGRATADAPPELRADESHARSARLGVWRE